MKFTVISHACLYIEHLDTRLIIDPWFLGSCYWRSWWNYPEPANELISSIRPTHIYLTHLHWDHFHGPSLRALYQFDPVLLLPMSPTSRMINDIKSDFKFSNVKELRHGKEYHIGKEFSLSSYQFNPIFIDSALAIRAGNTKLLNANDAKTFGWSLKNILKRYQSFDFVFRSHSSASSHPYCFPEENILTSQRMPSDFTNDFIAFSEAANTKYAVPFASSHVYLHRDTLKYNQYYNSPLLVEQAHNKLSTKSKAVVMPSGSSWSSQTGFNIINHDYTNISSDIKRMSELHAASLEKEYYKCSDARLRQKGIEKYFKGFINSAGFPFSRLRFGFFAVSSLDDLQGTLIIVDTRKLTCVFEACVPFSTSLLEDFKLDLIIKVSSRVLNDCTSKSMFNTFSASKLLLVYERKRGKASQLFSMLDLFENDMLPLWKILYARQFIVFTGRILELFDAFYFIFIIKCRRLPLFRLWFRLPAS